MRWIGFLCLLLLGLLWPVVAWAQDATEPVDSTESADSTDVTSEQTDTTSEQTDTASESSGDEPVYHTIAAGDTLFSIAVQYDTTIPELQRINNISPDTILHIGQELVISGIVPLPVGATILDAPELLQITGLADVPKVHTVQGGETIEAIAEQYAGDVETILNANQLTAESGLTIGQLLVIPGLSGDIIARDYAVRFGDSFLGLAQRFNTRPDLLFADEMVLNPNHLVTGQTLRLISRTGSAEPNTLFGKPHVVQAGETLLEIAAHYNQPPQAIATANHFNYPAQIVVGQRLRIPAETVYYPIASELTTLKISNDRPRQGEAFTLYLESADPITPTGRLVFTDIISTPIQPWFYQTYTQTFPFAPYEDGYVAIVGLDSFTYPGLYTLDLFLDEDETPDFSQTVEVAGVPYGFQLIELEDVVSVRSAENARLTPIYSTFSLTSTFPITEPFTSPLDDAYLSATYGAARSYANAPVRIFHSGVDFAAPVSTPIYAVADGVVVFNEFTELRGNVIILDHGLGIKTGYFHLSKILVESGAFVTRGTAIGALGNTGLSTGAHLHWDVRIRNVPINGQQWLSEPIFPFSRD